MKVLKQEILIFISSLIFCYISHKFNSYNAVIIYILVRIWIENKVGGSISYSVDRKVSDYVNELQKSNDKLQSNWNSLREWLENEKLQMEGYFDTVLDKMNELEGDVKE